jgi:uncharacterized protein
MSRIAIIGAGMAGLGASYYFANQGIQVDVYDKGGDIPHRVQSKDLLHGLGGAGGFSDGKLNFTGVKLPLFGVPRDKAQDFMTQLYRNLFEPFNPSTAEEVEFNKEKNEALEKLVHGTNIHYRPIRQKHIGSDNLPILMMNLQNYLENKRISFYFGQEIEDIIVKDDSCSGLVVDGEQREYDSVIVATGRKGQDLVVDIIRKQGVDFSFGKIDIGARVEVPASVYENLIRTSYDPKLKIFVNGTDVRTFCTNPNGYVVAEQDGDFISANGHALKGQKSENTNFALLNATVFDKSVDTHAYGLNIAKRISEASNGKILAQNLGDIRRKKPSADFGFTPTYSDVYLGNVWDFYPEAIILNLLEATDELGKLAPGVKDDLTLFYFPEIKLRAVKINLLPDLQSSVDNLYFAGDCSGLVGDIMHSSAMGWLVAQRIYQNMNF